LAPANKAAVSERLECELQIDHDYIAHATLRSLGRQEATQVEFHQLEFGLALPSPSGAVGGADPVKNEAHALGSERTSTESLSPPSVPQSNITLRSNLAPKGDDWRVDIGAWHVVPGAALGQQLRDAVEKEPARFAEFANQFRNVRPIYVRRLLEGFDSKARNSEKLAWPRILELIRAVIEQLKQPGNAFLAADGDDSDWLWCAATAATLLKSGLRQGEAGITVIAEAKKIVDARASTNRDGR
jgi:hypothetical protein